MSWGGPRCQSRLPTPLTTALSNAATCATPLSVPESTWPLLNDAHAQAVGDVRGQPLPEPFTNPLLDEARHLPSGLIGARAQDSTGHAILPVPAHDVRFAQRQPQTVEQPGGARRRDLDWLAADRLHGREQESESTVRMLGARPFDSQEIEEGLFVVFLAGRALECSDLSVATLVQHLNQLQARDGR